MAVNAEFLIIIGVTVVVAFIIQQLISSRNQIRSLEENIISLEDENSKLFKENAKLRDQTHKDILFDEYPFDKTLGIRKHRTSGAPFCNKCMIEKGLKSPLKVQTEGWYCSVCNTFIQNANSTGKDGHNVDLGF